MHPRRPTITGTKDHPLDSAAVHSHVCSTACFLLPPPTLLSLDRPARHSLRSTTPLSRATSGSAACLPSPPPTSAHSRSRASAISLAGLGRAAVGRNAASATPAHASVKPFNDLANPLPPRRTGDVTATSPHLCYLDHREPAHIVVEGSTDASTGAVLRR